MKKLGMQIKLTPKNTAMYNDGFKAYVIWKDRSESYYKNKKIAIHEMIKEIKIKIKDEGINE